MSSIDRRRDQGHSPRYVWYVIFLLSLVSVFNYMDRMVLSVLAPFVKADLALSDTQLGLLIGFAFSIFYAITGIPIARWADQGNRRNLIAASLVVWSVMTALSGAAQNFWQLLLARIGVGAGEAGNLPAAESMICDYVPLERRGGIFAIHSFGLIAGMMFGMVLSGLLAERIGWRCTFATIGLPGIALAILLKLTLREPERGFFDNAAPSPRPPSIHETVSTLWRCRTYRSLTIFVVTTGFVQNSLFQWLPSLYQRVFGLSSSYVGASLGVSVGVGSGIGLLAGGLLANRTAQHNMGLPLKLGAIGTSLAFPVVLASLFVSSAIASIVLISITCLLWSLVNGPVIALTNSVVPVRMRATAQAAIVFLTSALGFGLGPFCVGLLSDLLGPFLGAQSLRYSLLLPAALVPVLVLALYAAARTLRDDIITVEATPPHEASSIPVVGLIDSGRRAI